MDINENAGRLKPGLGFKVFRSYVGFFHDVVYCKKTYGINLENIPANGTPLMIVSNHQNCLNDPLGILFVLGKRKANFLARADVFELPAADKFMRFIGLLPAFRLNYEGEDALGNNNETFDAAGRELMRGRTVVIYPEAGHQDKRWLGEFSLGYLKLAFEAAGKENFQHDILILPSCNHYSNYFSMQEELLTKFGTPISLAPYYELYKEKPRTAQREVNKLVRDQIDSLMLNITDLENYDALDYLRGTYGKKYAEKKGFKPVEMEGFLPTVENYSFSNKAELAKVEKQLKELISYSYDEVASMLQDIWAGRTECEIDDINGKVVRDGAALGIETPFNSKVVEIVKKILKGELKAEFSNIKYFEFPALL